MNDQCANGYTSSIPSNAQISTTHIDDEQELALAYKLSDKLEFDGLRSIGCDYSVYIIF